jgi:regulator of protease activity HflC (stomatin/prohibitin superfamily)
MAEQESVQEQPFAPKSGWPVLLFILGVLVFSFFQWFIPLNKTVFHVFITIFSALYILGTLFGFQAIAPNNCRVYLLFGVYKGTTRKSGFYWVNPCFSKRKLSLRIRNFETGSITTPEKKGPGGNVIQHKSRTAGKPSKVNDRDGNPIEISAVVVWKVVNTAEALFEVDDYEDFVAVQSEAALRNLASRHPYDSDDESGISLRGSMAEVSEQLEHDIQERLDQAGVEVLEARISHLAYAPEIAAAMLQRQQATAIIAARTLIVDGAVGMVRMALDRLEEDETIQLDEERRAAMVSNLLVVLCGHQNPQPVINAGTLHQ